MRSETNIQVNDLESCRYFYRELLALGEPVIDSCAFTVFQLSEEALLALEKSDACYLEHASCATALTLYVENFEERCSILKKNGSLSGEEFTHLGRRARFVSDPEGNIIIIAEAKE